MTHAQLCQFIALTAVPWVRAIFVSPAWGALVVTIFLSYSFWTNRPAESYYIPVLFEFIFFAAGYVIYGIANLLAGAPGAWLVAALGARWWAGWIYAALLALLCSYVVAAAAVLPNAPAPFSSQIFGMVMAPMFSVAVASFYYLLGIVDSGGGGSADELRTP